MTGNTCHGPNNVTPTLGQRSIPGQEPRILAPASRGWTGKSLAEICTQLKGTARNGGRDLRAVYPHMAEDALVGWAGDPGAVCRQAPGSQDVLGQLIRARIDAGAVCAG